MPLRKARLNRYHSSDTVDQATISDRFRSLPSNVPQNHDDPFSLSGFFPSGIGLSNSGGREKEWEWLRPYDDHAHEDSLYEAAILHRPSAGEGWNAVGRSESGEAENTSSAVAAIKLDDKLGAMTVTGKPYLHQSQHSSDWVELKERGKKKDSHPDHRYTGLDEDELHGQLFQPYTTDDDGPRDDDRYAVSMQNLFCPENGAEDKMMMMLLQPPGGFWETMVCKMFDFLSPP